MDWDGESIIADIADNSKRDRGRDGIESKQGSQKRAKRFRRKQQSTKQLTRKPG